MFHMIFFVCIRMFHISPLGNSNAAKPKRGTIQTRLGVTAASDKTASKGSKSSTTTSSSREARSESK